MEWNEHFWVQDTLALGGRGLYETSIMLTSKIILRCSKESVHIFYSFAALRINTNNGLSNLLPETQRSIRVIRLEGYEGHLMSLFCWLTAIVKGGGAAQLENQYNLNISCNSPPLYVCVCVSVPSRVERGPVTPTIFGQ